MCLGTVDKRYRRPLKLKQPAYGYKCLTDHGSDITPRYRTPIYDYPIEFNKWLEAKFSRWDILAPFYRFNCDSGFHIFPSIEEATHLSRTWCGAPIAKVQYDGVIAEGFEPHGNVIVAKKMRVLEIVR